MPLLNFFRAALSNPSVQRSLPPFTTNQIIGQFIRLTPSTMQPTQTSQELAQTITYNDFILSQLVNDPALDYDHDLQGLESFFLSSWLRNVATFSRLTGDAETERDCLTHLLGLQRDDSTDPSPELEETANRLGEMSLQDGQFRRAKKFSQVVLDTRRQVYAGNSPVIAETSTDIAIACESLGKSPKAGRILKSVHSNMSCVLDPNDHRLGIAGNNLGVHFGLTGNLKRAGELLSQSHRILLSWLGANNPLTERVEENRELFSSSDVRPRSYSCGK